MVRNRMRASNAGTGAVAEHREARARTTSPRRPRRARPASAAPAPPRPAARGPPPLASSDRPAVPRSSREQRLPCAARARSIDRHGALLSPRPMTVVASSETNDSATAATSPALASPSRTKRRAVLAEAGRGARIPGRGVPAASDICTPAPSPVPGPIGRCSRGSDLRPRIGLLAARSGITATTRVARRAATSSRHLEPPPRAATSSRQAAHIVQIRPCAGISPRLPQESSRPTTTPPGAGHHVPTSRRSRGRSLPAPIDATTRCSTSPDSRDRRCPSHAARSPGRSAGDRPDARQDAERAASAASASESAWTSWSLVIFVRPWTSRSAASAKSSARLIPLKACCSACPRALGRRAGRCG